MRVNKSISDHIPLLVCFVTIIAKACHQKVGPFRPKLSDRSHQGNFQKRYNGKNNYLALQHFYLYWKVVSDVCFGWRKCHFGALKITKNIHSFCEIWFYLFFNICPMFENICSWLFLSLRDYFHLIWRLISKLLPIHCKLQPFYIGAASLTCFFFSCFASFKISFQEIHQVSVPNY